MISASGYTFTKFDKNQGEWVLSIPIFLLFPHLELILNGDIRAILAPIILQG